MSAGLQVPYSAIRESSHEEIERIVSGIELPANIRSRICALELDILHDRELCGQLGINYVTLNGGIKARYAAILVVAEDYCL